jgi:ADP-heptose:LPS heptosyltransferase
MTIKLVKNFREKKILLFDIAIAFIFRQIAFFFKVPNKVDIYPLKVRNILVIKLSAFGDTICMVPSIKKLQLEVGDVNVDWLTTNKTNPDFFDALNIFQKIYEISISKGFFNIIKILLKVRKTKYDLIIDFDQKYRISEAISKFGDVSVGFKTSYKGKNHSHTVDYDPISNERVVFYRLIEKYMTLQGIASSEPVNYHLIDFGDLTKKINKKLFDSFPEDLIIIYPGGGLASTLRLWSINNYKKLIENFIGLGYNVAIIGGSDEMRFSETLRIENNQYFDLINKLTLFEITELLRKKCKIFIGNDGGLIHLANSVDAKIIGIYGPSLYSKWGPLGSNAHEISIVLSCRPCINGYLNQIPKTCKIGTHACIKNITVDQVLKKFNKIEGLKEC